MREGEWELYQRRVCVMASGGGDRRPCWEVLINSSVYNGALLNVFLLWLICPIVTG